jgi:hypothetical protein
MILRFWFKEIISERTLVFSRESFRIWVFVSLKRA